MSIIKYLSWCITLFQLTDIESGVFLVHLKWSFCNNLCRFSIFIDNWKVHSLHLLNRIILSLKEITFSRIFQRSHEIKSKKWITTWTLEFLNCIYLILSLLDFLSADILKNKLKLYDLSQRSGSNEIFSFEIHLFYQLHIWTICPWRKLRLKIIVVQSFILYGLVFFELSNTIPNHRCIGKNHHKRHAFKCINKT